MRNPNSGVKSMVPSSGGTSPRKRLRYGSVTCGRRKHVGNGLVQAPEALRWVCCKALLGQ